MKFSKVLLVAVLALEGWLLLRPDGALVRVARLRERRTASQPEYWWRSSPVHMGCSIRTCPRPATRTATYRQIGPRGTVWRAYGFCQFHDPPPDLNTLVYRLGQPPHPGYDIPLTTFWSEVYFLGGIFAFAIWCACIWRLAVSSSWKLWVSMLLHAAIVMALFVY